MSPKSHFIEAASMDLSVNLTVRGALPAKGFAVKLAFGKAGFPVTVIVLLMASVPSALLAVRLIIAFVIGPRKQYTANELVQLTTKCLSDSMPLFVSDGLEFYAKALLKKFGETEEFPKTGKRGRPKNPKLVSPDNLRYTQVIKKRKGGRLQKIAKKIIFGEDVEENEISTSLL